MADLSVIVDYSDLEKAEVATKRFEKRLSDFNVSRSVSALSKLEREINRLVDRQIKGDITSRQYQKGIEQLQKAYQSWGAHASKAEKVVSRLTQRATENHAETKKLVRVQEEQARKIDNLKKKYDLVYRGSQLYKQELRDLVVAKKQGILTTDQYKAAVENLKNSVRSAEGGLAGFGASVQRNNRGLSHAQVITQQAGYQVGDFLVQVQSGTNAMVAFGQQATQVAGTLTLLGGKWVAIGTVLGIGIPLVTAIGAAYMRTRGEAEELTKSLDSLEQSMGDINKTKSILSSSLEELQIKFGDQSVAVRQAAKDLLEYQKVLAASRLAESVLESSGAIRSFTETSGQALSAPIQELADKFRVEFDRAIKLQEDLGKLIYAPKDELPALAETLRKTIETSGIPFKELPTGIQAAIVEATNLQITMAELDALVNSTAESAKGLVVPSEFLASNQEVLRTLQEELALLETKVRFGEDSLEYLRLEQNLRLESLRTTLEQEAAVGGITEAEQKLINEIISAREEADSLNRSILVGAKLADSLRDAVGGINFDGAISGANVLVARLGTAYSIALAIAQAKRDEAKKKFDNTDVMNIPGEGVYASGVSQDPQAGRIAELQKQWQDFGRNQGRVSRGKSGGGRKSGSSRGGGGAPKETPEDFLKALQKEVEYKEQLLGLYGEEKQLRSRVLDLKKQAESKELSLTEKQLEGIARREMAVEERLQREQDLYNTITNNIEQSLMGLIQGTESVGGAFKGLIQTIILEFYKQQVAQPLAKSIGGGISSLFGGLFADGGVFQGGTQVKAFANGGVVSGPTVFPMRNGVGLMGEAGPEAIMPLKRGPNGRLGVEANTSGSVNIVMNISTPDAQSFQRSRTQIASGIKRSLEKGNRNN